MAIRYEDTTKLYQETIKEISKDETNWMAFLRCACRNYRLPFSDMVLIYAQRPDAQAVLEMEKWNKLYGLWIKPGSKGIAVFDNTYPGAARLRYYFDISDTRTTEYHRPVPIWSMRKEFNEEVIHTLANQFGPLDSDIGLAQAIISASHNVVNDNIGDYLKDLEVDGIDDIQLIYQGILENSVAYATLSRCGLFADDYIDVDSLRQISQFNTPASINAIGVPTKDISQMIIEEIKKTVLMKERESNKNHTFEKKDTNFYNKDSAIQSKRSDENENRIHADGRIQDTQSDFESGRDNTNWQIWNDEKKVSQRTSSNSVYELSDNTNIKSALDRNRSNSQSEKGFDERTPDETMGRKREIKRKQSDEMDSIDEQHRGNDTGNHSQGTNLQLNTTINQAGTFYKNPAFLTLDEYEKLIKYDRFRGHKNKEIQTFFQFYSDMKQRQAYVKESFTKPYVETLNQEIKMGYHLEDDCLKIWKGNYEHPEHEEYIPWEDVTHFIGDMIERNVFLPIPQKSIPTMEEQQLNLFNMEPLKLEETNKSKPIFTMPQYIIDAILAEGTENTNDKLEIAIFLSLDMPILDNANFLRSIYKKGSHGFIINNLNVAYKWDTDGIQITWGKGIAEALEKQTLSWETCAKDIRILLEQGLYMPQEDLDRLKEYEYHNVAVSLMYMLQEIDYEKSDHMTELREYLNMGFVDGPPKLSTQLQTIEFYDRTLQTLYNFNIAFQQDSKLMLNSWKHYTPDKMITLMEHLMIPHLPFQAATYVKPVYSYFITQDMIDNTITNTHQLYQKLEIYSFYKNNHDKKARIKYLKELWGHSGSTHYNSDSKGLLVKTGSYSMPYASTLLKWKDVADRITVLIANDKFLNEKENLGMKDFEQHEITLNIEQFFHSKSLSNIRPYSVYESYYDKDNALYEFINDKSNVIHVLDLMHITLNNTDITFENYDNMKKCLTHVEEYYYGTYTLFNEKKEPWTMTPYEPNLDIRQSIAKVLTEFMEEFDASEYIELENNLEVDTVISDTSDILQDIGGLEDLILYLNEAIYEGMEPAILSKASILREEISVLYAKRKGSNLSEEYENKYMYRSLRTQELPLYNTGDFVFLKIDSRVYGKIKLIEGDIITLGLYPHNSNKNGDIEIDRDQFDKNLPYDYRNGYLFDQSRPLHHNEEKESEIQVSSDKERNTLGFQNFVLLRHIAPLIIDKTAKLMTFKNLYEDTIISIYLHDNSLNLKEKSLENMKEYRFAFDPFQETLNIRVIMEDGEIDKLELTDNQEPKDYSDEQQMNEAANNYIESISDRGFWLQSIDMQLDEQNIKLDYTSNGNIENIGKEVLKSFTDIYGKDPINLVSTLVPERDNNEQELPPSEIKLEKAISVDTSLVEETFKNESSNISNIATHKLYPEVPTIERHDFKISDFDLGVGGSKEKYKANIQAIKLLKKLDDEHKFATPIEQDILSRYVGWGSLPNTFDDTKKNWNNEYQELKELLTDTEYKAARESTLTAFYTPPIIIDSIYQKLIDMGLKEGNTLEPSCGVGNFIGMVPSQLDYNFYGVELDSISGRIAQHLYQNATIAIQGFEQTEIPNNLFDAVIGNVPYGQISVFDSKYNQQNFMIHDYFFAKALDKVKVGGVVIFLTSKFTMDKKSENVRKYLAQRADLLGAIRLPDNTFKANAGTNVTTDILILQKRERPLENEPEWIDIIKNTNGIIMNSYFINHPEMVLGKMVEESSQYGKSTACKPIKDADLKQQLVVAMSHIKEKLTIDISMYADEEDHSIPANPIVRNYSFCIENGNIFYRENSRMYPHTISKLRENRIRGMIQIRDCMRNLIDYQAYDSFNDMIKDQQKQLHFLYDDFTSKFGILNSRANKLAFQDDSSYSLICSLEILNEDKTFKKKADIFNKRTIKPHQSTISVKTASEALVVSMAEKGHIDFDFMTSISNINKDDLISNLQGVIFANPEKRDDFDEPHYETSDEYLSGNIREKLALAKHAAENDSRFEVNVTFLEQIQPEPIKAGDINVRLGTTWIPKEIYKEFVYTLLDTPNYYRNSIDIHYVSSTQEWNIIRKSIDNGIKATKRYGTQRMNAYKIIENTLNMRDVKIFDKVTDNEGNEVRILNKKETAIVQDKQDTIKLDFNNWIWKDSERREKLCYLYNENFNSIRNRIYDGSNLTFAGMNPDISLRKHQVDAIARILYGGNTLLAHSVGAGKTFEMIAAGMESKRLGFCSKPLYVVPNNIISDFTSDFYRLYPSANVLVATTDTLSKANRHKFFARITTGEWDGIIITHSQFIKMPVSDERQRAVISRQTEEISNNIKMLREGDGERFTIKQLEITKEKLQVKLKKLNDSSKKDDILCFEQLGIDMLFVDEADLFKNLFLFSKMRNVSGISQTDSQRASDLFMKTQYLDEITNYRGVVFATGTAISNSIAELYTMQRYLQYNVLQKYGLQSFDSWASTFGETMTAMELSPEGTGFKLKTRFSKFFNLPELMTMFREVADIQTAEMLNLPVPKAEFEIVSVPASEAQAHIIQGLAERAERIRNRDVTPYEDNMLKITSDGRKVALDQRLINNLLPDNENSKINACITHVYDLWESSSNTKGTQLVFCDLSTPTKDSMNIIDMVESENGYIPDTIEFTNVYDDIKRKLIAKGIPSNEIAFIHDAKTDIQRKDLFAKTRQGNVRILLGSTSKMGAGTNVQDLIVALHDVDCPWRPRDLEQRRGRGIRQGNINDTVHVIRYVTEGTFDAYLYQTIEKKQQFISQVLTGKTPQRSLEEIDEVVMEYAAIKAIACGDPKIMERCNLEMEVNKLNVLKGSYQNQIYELQDSIIKTLPQHIAVKEEIIQKVEQDIKIRNQNSSINGAEFVGIILKGVLYKDKMEAGNMLINLCKMNITSKPINIGQYRGFDMTVSFSQLIGEYILVLDQNWKYSIFIGTDKLGNLSRINNALNNMEKVLDETKQELSTLLSQLETSKIEVSRPFEKEKELQEKTRHLAKLTIELKLDLKEPEIIDDDEVNMIDINETKSKIKRLER